MNNVEMKIPLGGLDPDKEQHVLLKTPTSFRVSFEYRSDHIEITVRNGGYEPSLPMKKRGRPEKTEADEKVEVNTAEQRDFLSDKPESERGTLLDSSRSKLSNKARKLVQQIIIPWLKYDPDAVLTSPDIIAMGEMYNVEFFKTKRQPKGIGMMMSSVAKRHDIAWTHGGKKWKVVVAGSKNGYMRFALRKCTK